MVLQSQWVHRYGVSSMPALMVPAEVVPVGETVVSLESRPDPGPLEKPASSEQTIETLTQPQSEPVPLSQPQPLSQPKPVPSTRSSMPAPPLSTPRSLRRWLPGDDSSILQAS